MHYIKDIFEKKETEHAHNKFIRYSKGVFVGPLAKIKLTKANVKIGASFHFADELLEIVADIIGNELVHVRGSVVWNTDLGEKLQSLGIKYSKVSKSRGIFKYELDNDVRLREFVTMFNKFHLLISVKFNDISLTTKSSFPKPNKEFGADFCKVTLPGDLAKKVLSEFAFDVDFKGIKEVEIKHSIEITDIDVPDAPTFDEARRLAKRIGLLKREIKTNNSEKISEIKLNI